MNLKTLGWKAENQDEEIDLQCVARVAVENKGRYVLYGELGELEGIVQGKFLREAKTEAAYPKVGDWVLIEKLANEPKAIIKSILPRFSKISRKRAGEDLAEQIIATNIDVVFIVQGLDGDFNVSRLERYVSMAKEGGSQPVILLNKSDLELNVGEKIKETELALPQVKIFSISAKTMQGMEAVRKMIVPGKTVVFVGSSGVGKSSLVNALLGNDAQKIQELRADDSKGRHTTTRRELIVLPSGGIMIDTPGMRELGLWASEDAVGETFEDIETLAKNCKFNDCNHQQKNGCAVLEAVEKGEITRERYERYIKLLTGLDLAKAKDFKNKQAAGKRKPRRR